MGTGYGKRIRPVAEVARLRSPRWRPQRRGLNSGEFSYEGFRQQKRVWLVLLALEVGLIGVARAQTDDSTRAFVRVRVHETTPQGVAVNVGVSVFEALHVTLAKFVIGRDGRQIPFKTGFHDWIAWEDAPAADRFKAGEATPWVEVTEILRLRKTYAPSEWTPYRNAPCPKTLVFAFHCPDLPPKPKGRQRDAGNLQAVTAAIDFASRPADDAIVRTVRYESENSLIPLYVPEVSNYLFQFAPRIRTLHDYTADRVQALQMRGVKEGRTPKRILTSTRVLNGYFYPLYDRKTALKELELLRLLGIRYVMWKAPQPGIDAHAALGVLPNFTECGFAEWVSRNPWDENYKGMAKAKVTQMTEAWRSTAKVKSGDKVLVKLGDEIKLVKLETVLKEEGGVEAFRAWLRQRGVSAAQVGCNSLAEVTPIGREGVKDPKSALLFHHTVWFRQETQARWWKAFAEATREALGVGAIACSETFHGGFEGVPDWFLWSRLGVMDVQADEYAFRLWNPTHNALFKANLYRSAAKFGRTQPGVLWAPSRGLETGGSMAGPELEGVTALMYGMRHFYLFDYGPRHSGWGKNDDVVLADLPPVVAKTFRLAAQIEDYALDGQSPMDSAETAILLSRSTDLWDGSVEAPTEWAQRSGPRQGIHAERQMLNAALAWNQIPADWLPEEEVASRLNGYRLLYIVDPNVSREAQQAIGDWVRQGGILFTLAEAATRDEANQPLSLVESLAGDGASVRLDKSKPLNAYEETQGLYDVPVFGQVRWTAGTKPFTFEVAARKELLAIPGATALALYEDDSPAAVAFDCGKGKVIRIGTSLGTALARTAKPAFTRPVMDDQRIFDWNVEGIYLYPFTVRPGLSRRLRVSKPGVAANFFEKPDGAVLLMADYESSAAKRVNVDAEFSFPYSACQTATGESLPVERQAGRTMVRNVPLATSQVLLLR